MTECKTSYSLVQEFGSGQLQNGYNFEYGVCNLQRGSSAASAAAAYSPCQQPANTGPQTTATSELIDMSDSTLHTAVVA